MLRQPDSTIDPVSAIVTCTRCGNSIDARSLDFVAGTGSCQACGTVRPEVGMPGLGMSPEDLAFENQHGWRFEWSRGEYGYRFVASYPRSRSFRISVAVVIVALWGLVVARYRNLLAVMVLLTSVVYVRWWTGPAIMVNRSSLTWRGPSNYQRGSIPIDQLSEIRSELREHAEDSSYYVLIARLQSGNSEVIAQFLSSVQAVALEGRLRVSLFAARGMLGSAYPYRG